MFTNRKQSVRIYIEQCDTVRALGKKTSFSMEASGSHIVSDEELSRADAEFAQGLAALQVGW